MKTINLNRRTFINSSASAVAVIGGLKGYSGNHLLEADKEIRTTKGKSLIVYGQNLLNSNKVDYGDIRITSNRVRTFLGNGSFSQNEQMGLSVRVLVNGYWGFACSPLCTEVEMGRLVKDAVDIATYNSSGPKRSVELGPPLPEESGSWTTPVRIDPFDVHPDEINDFLAGFITIMSRYKGVVDPGAKAGFTEREQWFGSTEDRLLHQIRKSSWGSIGFAYVENNKKFGGFIDTLSTASLGWELFIDQPLREIFERELEDVKFDISLPMNPIDVGRYDTVMDSMSSGRLMKSTIANATVLSRIAGYNANDIGTSYIVDPQESYNTFKIGNEFVNVTSDRSEVGGMETVKWDAEGVSPTEVKLVTDGVITDYTTSREMEGWFRNMQSAAQSGRTSTGSTDADSAIELPKSTVGNVSFLPGKEQVKFMDIISNLKKGIAVKRMNTDVDFQCLNGLGSHGMCYEVRDGKRVALLVNAAVMFRAPEVWKSVTAVGGKDSKFRFLNVTSVPMAIKDCTFIDITRKA